LIRADASVIDNAATAVAHIKDPGAFDALTKLTQTPSWKGRIMIAGLNGLAELGDKRAFDIGYKIATDASIPKNQRTVALAVVGATGKGDARAYPLIYAQFKDAYDTNNIGGIVNGLAAIAKIGDPRGQEAFDLMKTKFKDNPGALQFVAAQEAQFKAAVGQK
jgi:hypothetical protein